MGLLSALNLPPSKELARRAQVAALAAKEAAETESEGEATKSGEGLLGGSKIGDSVAGERSGGGGGGGGESAAAGGKKAPAADDEVRRQAAAVVGQLEARLAKAAETRRALADIAAARKAKAAKAGPMEKPAAEKEAKAAETALATADARVKELHKAVETAGDPTASREDLARVLVLAKSKDEVAAAAVKETVPGGSPLDRTKKVVETEVKDGEARVQIQEKGFLVDADGVKHKDVKSIERVDADGSQKVSEGTSYSVGPDGAKRVKESSTEFTAEVDGEKKSWGSSNKDELAVNASGVTRKQEQVVKNADGSSQTDKREASLERGDGKVGIAESSEREVVDADGNSVTKKSAAKAGFTADDKGLGTYGEGSGSAAYKAKNGLEASAGLKLKGNVKCEIGDPKGTPAKYPVTIEVNCGAEFTFGGSGEKEVGADKVKAKASVEVTLGADYVFRHTRSVPEAEIGRYVAAMNEANAGSAMAATYAEMEVIFMGVTQGWELAQRIAKGQGPLSPEMLATLRNAGDSAERKTSKKGGVSGKGSARFVEVEGGVETESEETLKATRQEDGKVAVEADQADQTKLSGKGGLNFGGVGGIAFGGSKTWKTGFGFDIVVDPAKDTGGKALAALAKCSSKADFEKVVANYKHCVTLNSVTDTTGEAERADVAVDLLGTKATVGSGNATTQKEKRDAQGNLIEKETVGEQEAGGGIELPGGIKVGDSAQNKAVGKRDAEGKSSLDLSRKKNQSDAGKVFNALKKKVGLGEPEPDAKQKGAIRALAGGEEPDTQVHDVFGIKLTDEDLAKLGQMAISNDWAAPGGSNEVDVKAWRRAQAEIRKAQGAPAAVADQLSLFVGGSKKDRLALLRRFLRPGGNVSIGTEYSFPDGLTGLAGDYDELVVADPTRKVSTALAKWGPGKAASVGDGLVSRLRELHKKIDGSQAFGDKTAQAAMANAALKRMTALETLVRKIEGKDDAAAQKAAAQKEFDHACTACETAQKTFDALLAPLSKAMPPGERLTQGEKNPLIEKVNRLLDARAMLRRELKAAQDLAATNGLDVKRLAGLGANDKEVERIKDVMGMHHSAR